MENKGQSQDEAYDVARKEFYDLRMQEDIERRVAKEEALAVGATFGKSYLDIGIELEAQALEQWKAKALASLELKRGRQAAFSGTATEEDDTTATEAAPVAVLEDAEGEPASATAAATTAAAGAGGP